MWDFVLIFSSVAGICMVLILVCYVAIVLINKKLGLDINGWPIKEKQETTQQQIQMQQLPPQVIKVEVPYIGQQPKQEEDLKKDEPEVGAFKLDKKDAVVKSSFNGRIGKVK